MGLRSALPRSINDPAKESGELTTIVLSHQLWTHTEVLERPGGLFETLGGESMSPWESERLLVCCADSNSTQIDTCGLSRLWNNMVLGTAVRPSSS